MGPKSFETFEKQAPGPTARVSRSMVSANQLTTIKTYRFEYFLNNG